MAIYSSRLFVFPASVVSAGARRSQFRLKAEIWLLNQI
jgi:hypothetical protein